MTQLARKNQLLTDHLTGVARQCEQFCGVWGTPGWGKLVGISHDWGKANGEWQTYLQSKLDEESCVATLKHSAPGAAELIRRYGNVLGMLAAFCVAGHHTGLANYTGEIDRLLKDYPDPLTGLDPATVPDMAELAGLAAELQKIIRQREDMQLFIRMLFSALVDADRLDAERADDPEKSLLRESFDSFEIMQTRFDQYMRQLRRDPAKQRLGPVRDRIFEQCLSAAEEKPGFFTLNVPTGGGKTLAAMAFALRHRQKYGLRRIVCAIPYSSIIEQTASLYRQIFGGRNVLEHHCNFDLSDQPQAILAAENYQMPIIVTTNVQLFESLLGSRASQVRKIHNLAGSILILDEAQMLPPANFAAILATLRTLADQFGCTVVLCSATIPALGQTILSQTEKSCTGLPPGCDIIADAAKLAKELQRTRITPIGLIPPADLAAKLENHTQAMAVVNTKRHCRELYHLVNSKHKFHLSAAMCPAHRRQVLDKVRARLAAGEPVILLATSVVEAGVDLDFAAVYRECAGIDSIAQAAGRCNREGKLDLGEVFVFDPWSAHKQLNFAVNATREVLYDDSEFGPDLYRQYFLSYYSQFPNFDQACFQQQLVKEYRALHLEFKTFAENFHLIDNDDTRPLTVLYGDGAKLIGELRTKGPSRELFRKLQPCTINVRQTLLDGLKVAGCVEEIYGVYAQTAPGIYSEITGLADDNDNLLLTV